MAIGWRIRFCGGKLYPWRRQQGRLLQLGGYLIEIRINSLWSCAVEIADRGRRIAGDRAASLGQLSWMMKIYDDNDDGVEDDEDDEDDKQRQKSS